MLTVFCSMLWDVLKSLSDRANDIKHVKIQCSTYTHYVCVIVLCSILKNSPENFLYIFRVYFRQGYRGK